MAIEGISGSNLFAATIQSSAGLENLANGALKQGIDLYMNGNYKEAVKEFQRSMGLAPASNNSIHAANYMASSYLKLDDTEKAIKAYKTSLKLNPFVEETHSKLGNLYFSLERYDEAEKEYKEVVKLNSNGVNQYALGQVYLATERYDDAENIFNKVRRLSPEKTDGYFGLGLTYSGQERYEEAISQFEEALNRDSSLYEAHAEIGYAYADLGQMDMAQIKLDSLNLAGSDLADTLDRYMYKVDPPKIMFASSYNSTFPQKMPFKTAVSTLDSYLANADATKKFTMVFQFDKSMDRQSVENLVNWKIGRSTSSQPGQIYNYGLSVPDTEVQVNPLPDNVYYDLESFKATVTFTFQQNSTADGTIDPTHIEFKFSGKDAFGNKMDPDFDQYMGFSGSV
jgi:tetratricopeptide (TPR) repeat protein